MLFLYLNRHGYNGLCRYNLRGEFNVPFGRYKKPYSPRQSSIISPRKAQNAEFYCESYEECMQRADSRAVVYCDPPYAPLTATANFTAYHTNSFNLEQQVLLAAKGGIADEKADPGADFQPPHTVDAGMV
ncbi:methyl-directed repair DNA adenine methylase [Klebsiella variicola]|nr:methyl-directed repair DNA adenine methylase [Klebsiella variicola]